MRTATDALVIFRELSDRQMQGATMLVLVTVYLKGLSSGSRRKNLQDAAELAREALTLFQLAEEPRLAAEAMHSLATARVLSGNFEAGLRSAKDALKAYQELGLTRCEVFECQCIAEWLLKAGMAKQAQPYAEDGLALCQKMGLGSHWESSLRGTAVRVLTAKKTDMENALLLARQGVERAQEKKDRAAEAVALDTLATAQLAKGGVAEARESAEEAVKAVQELGHSTHE